MDHRADIYALGVVLYEMLTGERPENPLSIPSQKLQLDVRIDEIVLRALNTNPEGRYQTVGEFQTMVETVAETNQDSDISKTPSSLPTTTQLPKEKKGKGVFIGCLVALSLLIGLGLLLVLVMVVLYFSFSRISSDSQPLTGWVEIDYKANATISEGHGFKIPVRENRSEDWFPSVSGQQISDVDGQVIYVQSKVASTASGDALVSLRWKGKDLQQGEGEELSVTVGPENPTETLDFINGLQATVTWNPAFDVDSEPFEHSSNEALINAIILCFIVLCLWIVLVIWLRKKNPESFRRWSLIPLLALFGIALGVGYELIVPLLKPQRFEAMSVV